MSTFTLSHARMTRQLALAACLVCMAYGAPESGGQPAPPHFEEVLTDGFADMPEGPFTHGVGGWQLLQETDTEARIERLEDGAAALRIIDDHVAERDASCRLTRQLPGAPGRILIRLRMMMRQGDTGGVNQDMGLHLFEGRRTVFDLFFSGGELKSWQGEGWASFEPPVPWEEGRWYDIELIVDPSAHTVDVTVDGIARETVSLRRECLALDALALHSQRYARGELWAADLVVMHEPPPELRGRPSEAWQAASAQERAARWFPDEGARMEGGALLVAPDEIASMRRLLHVDMDHWPLLRLDISGRDNVAWSAFLRPVGQGAAHPLQLRSRSLGVGEYDLFAVGAWQGEQALELVVAATGAGSLRVGEPSVDTCPPHGYLGDPASVWQFVRPPVDPAPLQDPLSLTLAGTPGDNHVARGIPFPPGVLGAVEQLRLRAADGADLPLQTQTLSVWEDGSVRWLLVETVADIPQEGEAQVLLEAGSPTPAGPPLATLHDDAILLNCGAGELSLPRHAHGPISGMGGQWDGTWDLVGAFDDRRFRAALGDYHARVETNGPLRATVLVAGTMAEQAGGEAAFEYELRLTVLRDMPHLETAVTFTLVSEAPEVQLQEMTLVLGGDFPPGRVVMGAEPHVAVERAAGQAVTLLQDQRERFSLHAGGEQVATGTHAPGWMDTGDLLVAVRRFWQQYAKGLELSDESLRVELWAPAAPPRRFARGAAKTHHLLLASHAPGQTPEAAAVRAAAFEHPPTLYPGAEWQARSLGMGEFPLVSEGHAQMDAIYEYALERRMTEQQRRADTSFDMVHYGDINAINSEIDAHKAFFLQWARTGERRWLDFALDWALHSQDIDVVHYSPNPREVGLHHVHSPDHNTRGISLTHTWIEGQLIRYYLTGDRRSLLAADLAGRAFARSMDASGRMFDGGNPRGGMGSRGYGRALWALCELHRATHNPRYPWAMERLQGYLADNLRDDGAIPASHDSAGRWSDTDECPHFAAICAVGMARYAELTGDRRFVEPLERVARWQMSRGAMPEKLGIMYHNYPGGEVIHFMDACADMLEAWAMLHDLSGDPLYRDFAETVYDTLLEMNLRWRHDWTMAVVNVLHYLGRRDTWTDERRPPQAPPGPEAAIRWLRACQNDDGGFGVAPGLPSDMDATFRAVEALDLLGSAPADPDACAAWVLSCRNDDGGYAGEPGWFSNVAWTWFAVATLQMLGQEIPARQETAAWLNSIINEDGGSGSSPVTGPLAYRGAWLSSVEYTAYRALALEALEAPVEDAEPMAAFLQSLQVDGGGFRHRGGGPVAGYTRLALEGLAALGAQASDPEGCAAWLQGLRRDDGGYGWPGGAYSTLRNTAQTLLALERLGHTPQDADAQASADYVRSCQSPQGGFGHRPGHSPTVTATWYAVRALEVGS